MLLLLLFIGAGCGGGEVGRDAEGNLVIGRAEVTEAMSRSVAPGTRTLLLDGFNGTVTLQGTAGAAADLTFIKRARDDDEAAARERLADVQIQESGDANTFRYTMTSEAPERTQVDIRGTVPRSTRLEIRLANGNILLDEVYGPLTLTVENGTIRAGGIGESVTAQTRNGNVELGFQRFPAGSTARAQVGNGNLVLAVPPAIAARLDVRTAVGNISTDGLQFQRQDFVPSGAGRRFTAQLGDGTGEITLRTENGNVVIRAGALDLDLDHVRPADRASASEAAPDSLGADSLGADTLATDSPPRPMPDSLAPASAALDTSALDADTTVQGPQGDF